MTLNSSRFFASVDIHEINFQNWKNELFTVTGSENIRTSLKFVDIEYYKFKGKNISKQLKQNTRQPHQYSLIFQGQNDVILEQGSYHFKNSDIGDFDFFIVPMSSIKEDGSREEGNYYEAVASTFKKPALYLD